MIELLEAAKNIKKLQDLGSTETLCRRALAKVIRKPSAKRS
jgi:hypothetical protein